MMKKYLFWTIAGFAASHAPGALAADTTACGRGLICASAPQTVADAVMTAGYRAKLGTDDVGDPKVTSAAGGYDYTILFYGCKEHKSCDSLQFNVSFADDGKNTIALANRWNVKKRFAQMAVLDDGRLQVRYDVATVGGLNQNNFADVMTWWEAMMGELRTFFAE